MSSRCSVLPQSLCAVGNLPLTRKIRFRLELNANIPVDTLLQNRFLTGSSTWFCCDCIPFKILTSVVFHFLLLACGKITSWAWTRSRKGAGPPFSFQPAASPHTPPYTRWDGLPPYTWTVWSISRWAENCLEMGSPCFMGLLPWHWKSCLHEAFWIEILLLEQKCSTFRKKAWKFTACTSNKLVASCLKNTKFCFQNWVSEHY